MQKSIPVCYAESKAGRLTCRPHVSLLGPADSKSSHCEQTARHRRKLRHSRTGNYRIIKHSWVNSCVEIKRRCQVSVIESRVRLLTELYKGKVQRVGCRGFTEKFRVQSQASCVGYVADKEAI